MAYIIKNVALVGFWNRREEDGQELAKLQFLASECWTAGSIRIKARNINGTEAGEAGVPGRREEGELGRRHCMQECEACCPHELYDKARNLREADWAASSPSLGCTRRASAWRSLEWT